MAFLRKFAARRRVWADPRSFALAECTRRMRRLRRVPLPCRGRPVWVRPAAMSGPLRARLGTSDFSVIAHLLGDGADDGRGEYDAAIDSAARLAGGTANVKLVIDLGANIGIASALLAHRLPNAAVLAVEPDPANFALLKANIQAQGLATRVRCVEACIGPARGAAWLDRPGGPAEPWAITARASAPAPGGADDRVDVLTIDDLLAGRPGPIDLIKCDIEGGERGLFERPGPWLARTRVLVVELHAPYTRAELIESLRAASGGNMPFTVRELRSAPTTSVLLLERTQP